MSIIHRASVADYDALKALPPRLVSRIVSRMNSWPARDIIWELDYTDSALLGTSAAAISLVRAYNAIKGATFTRASVATAQTSASTVYTGYGVDDPRVANAGYGQGLVIEETRQNLITHARSTRSGSWSVGTVPRTAGVASPDGTSNAQNFARSASSFSDYHALTLTNGTKYAASLWGRSGTSTTFSPTAAGKVYAFGGANGVLTASPTWQRFVALNTYDSATQSSFQFLQPQNGNQNVSGGYAVDLDADLFQVETGGFATELILTTGAMATRSADVLAADWSSFVRNGRAELEWEFVPKANSADQAGLLLRGLGGTTNTYVQINTGAGVAVSVEGSVIATPGSVSFSAGQVVNFRLRFGNGAPACSYSINGGARTVVAFSAGTHGNVPASGSVSMMGFSGSTVLNSWLRKLKGYATDRMVL